MLCGAALGFLIGTALASGASPAQLAAQSEALQRIENARVIYDKRQMPRHIFGRMRFSISPVPGAWTISVGRSWDSTSMVAVERYMVGKL